jgi:hypothetical protein
MLQAHCGHDRERRHHKHTKRFDSCSTFIDVVRHVDLLQELCQKKTTDTGAHDGYFRLGPVNVGSGGGCWGHGEDGRGGWGARDSNVWRGMDE